MEGLWINSDKLAINIAVEQVLHGACLVGIARECHRYSASWCLGVRLKVHTVEAGVHLVAGYPLRLIPGSCSYNTRDRFWFKEVDLDPWLTVVGTENKFKDTCSWILKF